MPCCEEGCCEACFQVQKIRNLEEILQDNYRIIFKNIVLSQLKKYKIEY